MGNCSSEPAASGARPLIAPAYDSGPATPAAVSFSTETFSFSAPVFGIGTAAEVSANVIDPTVEIRRKFHEVSASAAAAQAAELERRRLDAECSWERRRIDAECSCEVTFGKFHTIVADVKLSKGWFYYEVGVLENTGCLRPLPFANNSSVRTSS
jgi:hypothetical protein